MTYLVINENHKNFVTSSTLLATFHKKSLYQIMYPNQVKAIQ